MKRDPKKIVLLIISVLVLVFVVYFALLFIINSFKRNIQLEAYSDVRRFNSQRLKDKADISKNDFSTQENFNEILPLVRYNTFTVWPDKSKMPGGADPLMQLEKAKKIGLNYDKVNKRGITGQGVNIGVIDVNMHVDHPEYADSIREYKAFGESMVEGSALSTGLISLVSGKTTGVAPDVGIYYAEVPPEKKDLQYYRDAMLWFEELNKNFGEQEKIRVVMLELTVHGENSIIDTNADMWSEMVEIAERSGITIIDCAEEVRFGACWRDFNHPNNFKKVKMGYPQDQHKDIGENRVLFPVSQKTVAEEYDPGEYGYQYVPNSGITWAMAEYVGTLALGYQCLGDQAKDYSVEWLTDKMYETAYVKAQDENNPDGEKYRIIDVVKFCEACQQEVAKK